MQGHEKLIQLMEQHGAEYKGTTLLNFLFDETSQCNAIIQRHFNFASICWFSSIFQVLSFTGELLTKVSRSK